jgi:predicted TIM-barrel fold metal-dependent hydrolase
MLEQPGGLSVIDSHVHFIHPEKMKEMLALMDEAGCGRFNLVCIPNTDGSNTNPAALEFKKQFPDRIYLSGALEYASVLADPIHAPDLLAGQVLALKAQGFDGLKLIEGKPQVRKLLPHPLDGPLYARMWQTLEAEGFPVVFHVNDPDEFWDPAACPEWALQSGWDYTDGSYPSKEELYAEVDGILQRHPGLKIIFAHFYFLSRELERAADFLEAHPTVCFDLAPHLDMYADFSKNAAAAREFFLHFQERILYGTDTDTRPLVSDPQGYKFMQSIPRLIRSILECAGEFQARQGLTYHGLGLPQDVLRRLYASNFVRIYGETPRSLP